MQIDISFDFRTDAAGRDPDTYSRTLREYHRFLWSKPLPNGSCFDLKDTVPGAYLHHSSELGEFYLASDSAIPTFTKWKSLGHLISLFPEHENEAFRRLGYTIGGMMIFPGNRIEGKQTINGARGFNRQIADRFDLTLECIRRHYLAQTSPLAGVLQRYKEFFMLFDDFKGYVEFFMLQDVVVPDCGSIKFFMPFENFQTSAVPKNVDTYISYRALSLDFVRARNRRIEAFDATTPD